MEKVEFPKGHNQTVLKFPRKSKYRGVGYYVPIHHYPRKTNAASKVLYIMGFAMFFVAGLLLLGR